MGRKPPMRETQMERGQGPWDMGPGEEEEQKGAQGRDAVLKERGQGARLSGRFHSSIEGGIW